VAQFRVLVAGVPYGYQGDFSDGRWLTAAHRTSIEGISPDIRLTHPSVFDLNEGRIPEEAPHAVLVETSGAEHSWENLPAILFGEPFLRLIGDQTVFVQSCSAGVEQLAPLLPRTIPLCNASGVHANAIAETVLASILARAKMLYQRRLDQDARMWRQLPCQELTGSVMCVLGTGHIGSAIAGLARPFGIETIGIRRHAAPAEHFDTVLTRDELDEVLARTDYLIVACPLTAQTRGLIREAELKQLKKGAYLVNISRGPIVDESALVASLERRHLGGAFLDCHNQEPLPPQHPLWALPGVEISPHDSHASQLIGDRHVALLCENLKRAIADQPLVNVVNLDRGY
jgi:phosphoglycerate dehydrogenase-like enzyme